MTSAKHEYGASTNVGLVRNNNEDTFLAEPDNGLWLIADGMGGHDAGEVASEIVKESVLQSIKEGIPLKTAINQSHQDVKHAAENDIGSPNMGTTIVALLSKGANYQVGWVGDSRAYVWDPLDHKLSQLSTDHSYVQALFDAGSISEEEMHSHPQKNIITQSLGVTELDKVDVDVIEGSWETGQKILLCSDGLTDLVSDDEITLIFRKYHSKSNQDLVDGLIQAALDKGGIDNVSILVVSAPENINELSEPSPVSGQTMAAIAGASVLVLSILAYFLLIK